MTQLILGTAQLGSAYGVTNTRGRLADDEVRSLLELARAAGVVTFDTAADYGDSQQRLGAFAPSGGRYVTKFSLPAVTEPDADSLYGRSMADLRVSSLAGLMFHKMSDLDDSRAARTIELMREARDRGAVERIGVSIYDDTDLAKAVQTFRDLTLMQFPGNILDGHLLDSPVMQELHASGVELHVRSAFLQGILLADPSTLSPFFAPLAPALVHLAKVASHTGTTVLGLALRYLRDHPLVDGVVVGATTPAELEAILAEWQLPQSGIESNDLGVPRSLLDPRLWPR
jgi:aryl-alcohol dehydrogenase-like predicted oxidoreductase